MSWNSKLVYSFGSLSLKPEQGSRDVHFTVLAPYKKCIDIVKKLKLSLNIIFNILYVNKGLK